MLDKKEKIYSEILKRIESGEYAIGAKIPTGRALAAEFGVTHWCIHTIINELEDNGFVDSRRALGTFVKQNIRLEKVSAQKSRGSKFVTMIAARNFYYLRKGYEDIIGRTEQILTENGFNVNYAEMPKTPYALKTFLKESLEQSVKAIVIFPELEEWSFMHKNVHVFMEYPGEIFYYNRGIGPNDTLPFNSIGTDMKQSGILAADWIARKNFKRIAFFCSGSFNSYWLDSRYAGFKSRLEAAGLNHTMITRKNSQNLIPPVEDFVKSETGTPPALVASNDDVVQDVYSYILDRGFKPGKDFHMVSFGNLPSVRHFRMTNVAWPLTEAAELLARGIMNTENAGYHDKCSFRIQLKPYILER
jgi:DNA-binding LacI/PurR family transcriptional regulator